MCGKMSLQSNETLAVAVNDPRAWITERRSVIMHNHTTPPVPRKTCSKCGRSLPLSHFHADGSKASGLASSCRDCKRAYRQANKHRLLEAQYARRANNPDYDAKRRAWNALYYALRTGKIARPDTCEVCGGWFGERIQAHHEDYDRPYDVIWCCSDCHAELDRARRERETSRGL